MKKFLRCLFVFSLITTIFVSGNGVVVAIHTCFSSDSKNVSLFNEESCCSGKECNDNSEDDCLSSKCCSSEVSYHKINAPFLPQKLFEFPAVNLFYSQSFSLSFYLPEEYVTFKFIPPIRCVSIPFLHKQLLI